MNIPNITFATKENMNMFWGFTRALLSFASPFLMIAVAIVAVGMVITIIVVAFKKAGKENDDDKDEYEIKHY